ncbi:hypothetical protein [Variovorax sp. DXTD-1]|uniref:hypothetical protein n=1 Tax=Variovorax sp. DXTD-1 TaxID=2495592 RepID=UPI000F867052|nr:hypothetical protein [Variovorax sp. DXTD-1]RST46982.1 hypothetical protein EJI00_20560 [Variovorax sp. DXTD-1]
MTKSGIEPQRSLEELLPEKLREGWLRTLADRREAYRTKDEKKAEAAFQYGLGFVHALYQAELVSAGARDDLRELLISPDIRR